ncbi:uncharacterized protein ACWYII_004441 isoform 3-T4 [Salvelinus alpinus]
MSSLSHSDKEEVCWTEEEEAVTVKQEVENEDVTVKEEEKEAFRVKEEEDVTAKEEEKDAFRVKEEEDVTVKEEEEDVFGVKIEGEITVTLKEEEEEGQITVTLKEEEEEGQITVTLKEEEEEETGDLSYTDHTNASHRVAAATLTWWSQRAPPTWSPRSPAASGTADLRPTRQSSSQPMLPSSPSTSWH